MSKFMDVGIRKMKEPFSSLKSTGVETNGR
jgi:hypothetical protein